MRRADRSGRSAYAWKLTPNPLVPAQQAALRAWLVTGWFHPLWNAWEVSGIHLRDIPGVPPAEKDYPQAEYEIMIVSLHPDFAVDPDDLSTLHPLLPADLRYQCHGVTDAQIVVLVDEMITQILAGKLSPDVDYRLRWTAFLEDLRLTLRHESP